MAFRAILSTPSGGELASVTGTKDQVMEVLLNWVENLCDGDVIRFHENVWSEDEVEEPGDGYWASTPSNVVPFKKPVFGSQEWAETRGDDIPSYDEPGDSYGGA